MTKALQEHFDYVVSNLLKQGERSLHADGGCAYRGRGGMKCAAGWLIPDSKYNSSMEGESMTLSFFCVWRKVFPRNLQTEKGRQLIYDLQAVHDSRPVDQWRSYFAQVATERNLSDAVCKEPVNV